MKEKIIFTNGLIDLAQPRLGTKVIYKTDDFFASANRIISPTIPVFKDGVCSDSVSLNEQLIRKKNAIKVKINLFTQVSIQSFFSL